MNEQTMQKRVLKITFFTIFISILLIFCSCILIFFMQRANQESYDAQLHALLAEYKINMERQFDSDFQSLETLSPFLNLNFDEEPPKDTNQKYGVESSFLTITYYEKDTLESHPILSLKNKENYSYDTSNGRVQELIQNALQGKRSISTVHFNERVGEDVITYVMPVYGDNTNTIIGALTATKNTTVFLEILSQSTTTELTLDVDWIRSDGSFVTWSPHSIVTEQIDSIYDDQFVTPENQEIIKKNMKKNISFTSSFIYENKSYPLHFYPLEINGWYLICLDQQT